MTAFLPERDVHVQEYVKSICRILEDNITKLPYGNLHKAYVYSRIAETMMQGALCELSDELVKHSPTRTIL